MLFVIPNVHFTTRSIIITSLNLLLKKLNFVHKLSVYQQICLHYSKTNSRTKELEKLILLIELVCNLEHRNMDMIMFSQNVTHNNYYSDYTYINGIRELRFAQFMERQVQYCCLIGNALY